MTGEIVRFEKITKEFPGVKALDRVSFEARPGEVLALLGENGAGKSTLLKILSGDYSQDSGRMFLGDELVSFDKPSDALACGISVIYQDRHIMNNLGVAENIFAGDLPSRFGFVDWRELTKRTNELLTRFHIDGTATKRVGSLSPANQQMVEIAKDLNRNVRIIAFDEPTASLSESEIDVLFETIRELKDAGVTVFYVSHRMKEVFRICDRAVVLKDGRVSGEAVVSETNERELVSM
ncbi:MAG: ATP-binding cassette domain-containing protein, partial [Spirochaetales bacterium]